MPHDKIEVSVKGKWTTVPALDVDGKKIFVKGKWLKVAGIHQERFQETEVRDPELCIAKLKEHASNGFRADIFTFAQRLTTSLPKYSYPMELDSVAAVRTTSFQEWWDRLPQSARKNVRRSQKRGVIISVRGLDDEVIRGITEVNNASAIRQGAANYHYGKSLDQVRKDQSSFLDRSDFICAYLNDEMIGFLKIVYAGDVAATVNLAVKPSHYDYKPANALIAKAVELCALKGVSYLRYGQFNYGNKADSSLRDFKINNGFVEIFVPRFLVPLTIWGSICLRAKLHRGLLGILPSNLIAAFSIARSKWYHLLPPSRQAR